MGRTAGARRTRRKFAVYIALTLLFIGCVVRLKYVHRHYDAWALWPAAKTSQIEFSGRTYLRGDHGSPTDLAGFARIGDAPGDGQVFGPLPQPGKTVTLLWIRYPDGEIVAYGLSGGP